jgi:hypothetical protein
VNARSSQSSGTRGRLAWALGCVLLAVGLTLLEPSPASAATCEEARAELRALEAESVALMKKGLASDPESARSLKSRLAAAKERLKACEAGGAAGSAAGGGASAEAKPAQGKPAPGKAAPAKPKLDAEASDKKILDKFGKYILESVRKPSAASVTKILSNEEFKKQYEKDNGSLDGFETTNAYWYKGKIYINDSKANEGTPVHEGLHHYTHREFRKQLHKVKGVKFEEGVTEYFTRQTVTTKRTGIYDHAPSGHAKSPLGWAQTVARELGEETLRKAYFQGDAEAIKKIREYLEGQEMLLPTKKGP